MNLSCYDEGKEYRLIGFEGRDNRFPLLCLSKVLVTYAVLRFVDRGELDWNSKIIEIFDCGDYNPEITIATLWNYKYGWSRDDSCLGLYQKSSRNLTGIFEKSKNILGFLKLEQIPSIAIAIH